MHVDMHVHMHMHMHMHIACARCAHQASATCIILLLTMAMLTRPATRGSTATLPTLPACCVAGCAAGRRGQPRG